MLHSTDILVVADPAGVRIGSGGGTLNAIQHFVDKYGMEAVGRSKIAIVHSGGDSRRAPLHSVCGKAWASINSVSGDDYLCSPMAFLLLELDKFCVNLGMGSLVIASSDVLLDICEVICVIHNHGSVCKSFYLI